MKAKDFRVLGRLRARSSRFARRPLEKVPQGISRLVTSLREDAARGDPAATTGLAYLYTEFAIGAPREGLRLYRKAMALGEPAAHAQIGFRLFDQGDRHRGLKLMETASEYGVTEAQVRLGYIYMYGRGARKDLRRAELLLQRAWRRGNPDAAFWLGVKRELVERRPAREGAVWYARAARAGVPSSMFSYGRLLETGAGVRKDRRAALRWYEKASALGDLDGAIAVKRLRGRGARH